MMTLSLNDSELFRYQAYIGGRWCEADNGSSFQVTNPATGEVLAQVPDMGAAEHAVRLKLRKQLGPGGDANRRRNARTSSANGMTL
jgi:acyl-CoA reductase-like NAD-dependent aldehyde dehydrogenase